MGHFLSKRQQEQNNPYHHRQQYNYQHHHPPPPPSHPPPPVPQTYASTSTVAPQHPPPPPPAPYTTHQVYNNNYNYNNNYSRLPVPAPPQVTHQNYQYPYYVGQNNGWFQPPGVMMHPPPPPPLPLMAPAPYVDHQSAKKVKNDVNVHKDTIKLEVDEDNKDFHLVSFTFDALVDGSIAIYYFAKEGANCSFTPLYPEIHVPVKVPFQQGSGQKFRQPSGTGIDLGFFDMNDLSKPSVGDIFPLVISAETYASASTSSSSPQEEEESAEGGPSTCTSPHAQITQAVIEKDNESRFRVKVMKQILWVDQERYELREIFGMSDSSDETTINDKDIGQECVICLTEPKDTAVLPCRHMCMCRGCANELRVQSNKCPICRQPIQELLEIKVVEEGKQNLQ